MAESTTLVYTPAGLADPALAIAACRAGAVGVLNGDLEPDAAGLVGALDRLAAYAEGPYGLKLDRLDPALERAVRRHAGGQLRWLIVDGALASPHAALLADLRGAGVRVLHEVTSAAADVGVHEAGADGLVVKGNEAGGFVGENSSFILLQQWRKKTQLPLYVHGGYTPHVAAACTALGVAGGVLDAQLLLMDEVRLPELLRTQLANLSGSETVAVGDGESGEYFRVLVRPGLAAARQFVADGDGLGRAALRDLVSGRCHWREPARALLPIGHDVAFAALWRDRYRSVGGVLRAFSQAIAEQPGTAQRCRSIDAGAPLALTLGVRYPIIQGPMTRVSDTADFAFAVAEGGALPMLALAVMKGRALEELLQRTAEQLGSRAWGIGLLGFAPQELLDEQLAIAARFAPRYAIIAGGRPDQAVQLEQAGVASFLHVPSANLIPTFLQEGARRFIFEGRECGGHIGPLSSFVLWSSIVDRILAELGPCRVRADELQLVFAGGIHDDASCAVAQIIAAPLAAAGAQIGILMGSAYLFTREIVATGAVVEQYQREVIECDHTVNLESGVGHASRCAYTPFARDFFGQRAELKRTGLPADERRRVLDELILGRLRIASKGLKRDGVDGAIQPVSSGEQHEQGMYMLGQAVTLRSSATDIRALHDDVTAGAAALVDAAARRALASLPEAPPPAPADIAIIGAACVLPKANSLAEYWDNIVGKVDAITEIPAHRWDWRLYFDADRDAKDKIYSRWGGFLDDIAFDPTSFGMPPKSVEAVDPMQLMGLEVARRTLQDAGYQSKPFDRERASVIIGASGGIGDIGMQYGLRSELPRFSGELPSELAERLPEWTEDSFAGILPNVAAGRIANRLNFGGMNITTDAACASSLAAIYQAVTELTAGRSDLVIAGGLDTVQGPFGYLCFSKTQALSPRGKCSTFDAHGDGIVISEGIAMVALKRLADAQRDGDRIYAVIKGVGASSDGNAKGLTAPLPAGQLRAMSRAYAMAGFGPSSVGLFEAHGTGTVAGDTAELESTTLLMRAEGALPRQAVIGSVKTMIGHTKATAGAAGLVKAMLALHHKVLPPHSNVGTPNRALADPTAPLYLLDDAAPWLAPAEHPRRAACSAFGFGGTNFHVVMEEYSAEYRDWLRPAAANAWSAELFVFSAADRADLLARVESYAAAVADVDGLVLRDAAASLAAAYARAPQTLALVARGDADLRAKLEAALGHLRGEGKSLPPGAYYGESTEPAGKVAVLFSGQGSQYPQMIREAAVHFEPVRDALGEADHLLREPFTQRFGAGSALSGFIYPRGAYDDAAKLAARQRLASTDVAQPALGAVEAGLFRLMAGLGLSADMYAGHSYGEFVALHAAGAIDFAALMALSAARGRFIVDAADAAGAELGTMAAVNGSRAAVEAAIAGLEGVVIANHNAPLQVVISGTRAGITAATAKLRASDVEVTELPVAAAFHSPLVRPAQQALSELIARTPWAPTAVPVYSNTTGQRHETDPARVQQRMAEHLVGPVEFVAQIQRMHEDGARIFVEIGPKAVLARLTARILEGKPHVAIAVDDGTGLAGLLGAIGQLLCAGVALDLSPLFARRDCRVGDASAPATAVRTPALSRHAWLINGSVARRAGTPVRQVGVTLEQVHERQSAREAKASAASPLPVAAPSAQPVPASRTAFVRSQSMSALPARREERSMDDERRPPPGMANSAVMSEYFETMRQFLETQERVMGAYLGAPRTSARALPAPVHAPRMTELAAAPVIVPTAKQHVPVVPAAPAPVRTQAAAPAATPAAPAPAATPAPAPAAAAPVPAVAAAAAAPAPAPAGGALTREKLLDMLLGIVEQKTGYPRDMLGLDQNLEADLGIDSIKRVEVVGAMLKLLPDAHREALSEVRTKINTQATLNGMLDLIAQAKVGGAVAVPFDSAGVGAGADYVSNPPRLVMRARREAHPATVLRHLTPGAFVLTRDARGVCEALGEVLRAAGAEVLFVGREVLIDEAALLRWCAEVPASTPIAGVVHLAALGTPALAATDGPAEWRAAMQLNEKSFFLLLRELSPRLAGAAHVVAASDLGGLYGREGSARSELRLVGGALGAVKSLLEERPTLRAKAVDLDPARSPSQLAADLLAEIEVDGGRQEVGYPGGERTIFTTEAEEVTPDPAREAALEHLVVLATAGARGITAEVLREIARPGTTLVLTGRSAIPEHEPADTASLADAAALRQHVIAQARQSTTRLTPRELERRVQSVLDLREMRANLADSRASGATVEYHSVDVTDEAAMAALLDDVRRRHGAIQGVVHGAGVIEDKLLADKQSDSWSRVVQTKVMGLLLLQKLIDPAHLKFFAVFSSVAGRYGNSGQSDYATANELMNRLCAALQARWGARVAVSALCWGPWGPTKFGAGMVTAETEAKFELKKVYLVTAALGRRLFRQEITRIDGTPVEIICGQGPWEETEARLGAYRLAPEGEILGPLLGAAEVRTGSTGTKVLRVRLDPARQAYLGELSRGGATSLPPGIAVELVAEAARHVWPRWTVAELSEVRLLQPLDFAVLPAVLEIHLSPPPYGSSDGFEASAALKRVDGDAAIACLQCVVRLEQSLVAAPATPRAIHRERTLPAASVYGEYLARGARLQVIEKVDGLSATGLAAHVRGREPGDWLAAEQSGDAGWVFDPALLDGAGQLLSLWARAYRDQTAQPLRIGRIVRYLKRAPARLNAQFERAESADPAQIRGSVVYFGDQGAPVLAVEDIECSAGVLPPQSDVAARAAGSVR